MIAGDDFARLLGEVVEPYRMIGLIAATDLMIGELLALRWRSLDLKIGTLTRCCSHAGGKPRAELVKVGLPTEAQVRLAWSTFAGLNAVPAMVDNLRQNLSVLPETGVTFYSGDMGDTSPLQRRGHALEGVSRRG